MFTSPRFLIACALLTGACAGSGERAASPENGNPPADLSRPAAGHDSVEEFASALVHIEAPILARSGSKLTGKATFTETAGGVDVTIEVVGAPPGKLATHVHQKGDCSAADASSAGEHFNPLAKPHGLPSDTERHMGDLGNIEVAADGTGTSRIVVPDANLKSNDPDSFLGRSLIIHAKQDDGGQPSGNAGGRIGCVVITAP